MAGNGRNLGIEDEVILKQTIYNLCLNKKQQNQPIKISDWLSADQERKTKVRQGQKQKNGNELKGGRMKRFTTLWISIANFRI